MEIKKVLLCPATMGIDLGDGSERAEYVGQDYILHTLGRPHRNINIMYTYYPKDKEWPQRISEACKDMEIHFQWDYPYDDYYPYEGGLGKDTSGQPFEQMRDIRKHGQDVTLTLTIDCSLEEEYLTAIAKELRTFGRMRLRINHECSGDWFTHNQRFSYEEIGAFFVKFCEILKKEAPNVRTVFCAGAVMDLNDENSRVQYEEEFLEAYRIADIWSMDCYLALHYGWPFDICEKDSDSYAVTPVEVFYQRLEKSSKRFTALNHGNLKPLVVSEFNTDGDVTGPLHQGESIRKFIARLKEEHAEGWFDGFSMYQFRDRGRLGLEIEDPNNKSVGIPQPLLKEYKEIISDPYFLPNYEEKEKTELPVKLRWGGAEDADGILIYLELERTPEFFEIILDKEGNFMLQIEGKWFYKAPGTERIDLMPLFFEGGPLAEEKAESKEECGCGHHHEEEKECGCGHYHEEGEECTSEQQRIYLAVAIFAPPATGENDPAQGEDWAENYYYTMKKEPEFRIRYEVVREVPEKEA